MNVMHEQVCHQQFGTGTIISQTESMIEVEFGEKYKVRKFVYPSVFEKFLTLSNAALQNRMNYELRQTLARAEAEGKQREQEAQKQREDENRALLEKKRPAKKRAPAKKTTK